MLALLSLPFGSQSNSKANGSLRRLVTQRYEACYQTDHYDGRISSSTAGGASFGVASIVFGRYARRHVPGVRLSKAPCKGRQGLPTKVLEGHKGWWAGCSCPIARAPWPSSSCYSTPLPPGNYAQVSWRLAFRCSKAASRPGLQLTSEPPTTAATGLPTGDVFQVRRASTPT